MIADVRDGRIWVSFPYSPRSVQIAKEVPGHYFSRKQRAWSYPLDLKTARLLREAFGRQLQATPALREWSRHATHQERRLRRMVVATDAKVDKISKDGSDWLRPYQRADILFMAERSCVNANQPGLGKTTEVVCSTIQAGLDNLPHLVISPVTSLDSVWLPEIRRWTQADVFSGTTLAQRKKACELGKDAIHARGEPAWMLINPETFKTRAFTDWAAEVQWGAVIIDEFHGLGLNNSKSQLHAAMHLLHAYRKWPLSGTPLGGVPLSLWSALNWVDPKAFPSKWRWAEQWLDKHTNPFGTKFGGIKKGREQEFYRTHAPWLIRRLKSEVAPELPPKTYREVWVDMRPAQARQYQQFAENAEIRLTGRTLVGTSKLTEAARLKLFAFGSTVMEGDRHMPTADSPKLDALVDRLRHHQGEQALVFSQFRRVVDVTAAHLSKHKFKVGVLSGATKNRTELIQQFQAGKLDVMVIVTKAAGVSITLDQANSVHMLDRTWNPDDQEQAEDRAHRISRVHNVTVYYYGTRGTIDEAIAQLNLDKTRVNVSVLDQHRPKLLSYS